MFFNIPQCQGYFFYKKQIIISNLSEYVTFEMKLIVIFFVALTSTYSNGSIIDNYTLSNVLTTLNDLGDWNDSAGSPLTRNVDGLQAILNAIEVLEAEGNNYTVEYLADLYGYPIETHYVTTSDGYILTLHRIPSSPNSNSPNGRVAFLQHGLTASAADWLIIGPDNALSFLLADEGYDVWLGNARGNTWSKNYTTLSPGSTKFWKFSWHEIGIYDIPAMIDYALNTTGASSVYYVGHSQGTTVYYVMLSKLPSYNSKIKVAAHLAPIGFLDHMTSPLLRLVTNLVPTLDVLFTLIGEGEFLPTSYFFKYILGDAICAVDSVTQFLCTNTLFALFGFDYAQMNQTLLPLLLKYIPAGASTKQFLHYGQEINSGRFCEYTFSTLQNLVKYGTLTPPDYPLSNITAPTYLYWSENDWLSAEIDVNRTCSGMGAACKKMLKINYTDWNHIDYTYANDVRKYVNDPVIDLFNEN